MIKPDADSLRRALSAATRNRIERVDAFASIDSTNSWLESQVPPQPGNVAVAIADHQTAGRGRHDRRWLSAPGCSLCLSLAYTFNEAPQLLPPLTLAVGVAAADALADIGVDGVRLKWPNDLLVGGAKLGGILVESRVSRRGTETAITVVAGIGINLSLQEDVADAVDSAWAHGPAGLDACGVELPERDELAARLVDAIVDAMRVYDAHGLAPFEKAFIEIDWLMGRAVIVDTPDGEVAGVGAGIERDGSLLLRRNDRVHRIFSGTIRIDDRRPDERQAV